jgi:uncharacterized membrane protein YeaQ/YmgE (transglycosylase-associated protein family)
MNFIIWLVIGGIIGWLASILMKTNDKQVMVLNVTIGFIGAMFGGWFITPTVRVDTINEYNFSMAGMLVSLVGAAILLVIVDLSLRSSVRHEYQAGIERRRSRQP